MTYRDSIRRIANLKRALIIPAFFMSTEHVNTLVIGGGQAGLAMSHMLKRRGVEHMVLERHRIGERWRSERWDGLRFQFPNWSINLPDFPLRSADPDGYATAGEFVNFITAYAEFESPPIRCGINVIRLECRGNPGGFLAESREGTVTAENVVVATGPYQRPAQPSFLPDEAGVFQIHASSYRNPDQLPAGAVLIVGSGASGAQIAEELVRAGRRVYLSIGRHRRLPRRYRGRDLIWWLTHMGLDRKAADQRGDHNSLPLISGAFGGNTIDFRQFAAMGVVLLGRLVSACGSALQFAPDLGKNLAFGDASFAMFLDMVDVYIDSHNLDVPDDSVAREIFPDPSCLTKPINRLDIGAEDLSTIISATGYRYDFGWIEAPVLDGQGKPVHRNGITEVPGLYFLGLQWLSMLNSSLLSGVGKDAARLADHIATRG